MNRPIIIVGAGGHGRVLADTLRQLNSDILGVTDPLQPKLTGVFADIHYLGRDDVIRQYSASEVRLVNALGSVRNTQPRADIYLDFKADGYGFANVIHPSSQVLSHQPQGEGIQVLAGAIVNVDTLLGHNVLINTGVIVEHGCRIGPHTHIASGAIICGDCHIGDSVHIGAGSTVIQGIRIGDGAIIAAGSVVTRDIPSGTLVAGVPAEIKRQII